jgi:molybdopterin synthase catalytic subunit
VAEAEARWPVRVALEHRIGALEIGDAAVAIAAGAAHREEAFAACRFVIEEVKRRVPIWKKEFYADGTITWVGAGGALVGDSHAGTSQP